MKTFDTVAKLKLAKLKEGQFVETGGQVRSATKPEMFSGTSWEDM